MDDTKLTSFIHILDIIYKAIPIFIGVAILVFVYVRTGSIFLIFHKILQLIGLDGKYSDPVDQKMADEYLDLNKFNFKTGLRLKTVKAKKKLHIWMRQNDIEYAELLKLKPWLNANDLRLEIPTAKFSVLIKLLVAIAIFILMGLGSSLLNTKEALFQVKATETWFWINENVATSFGYDLIPSFSSSQWKMNETHCKYDDSNYPVGNSWDKSTICQLVLGMHDDAIDKARASQHKTGLTFLVMGSGWLVFLIISMSSFKERKELFLRKSHKNNTPPYTDSDADSIFKS